MRFKRIIETLRDFGSSIEIWSEAFINYTMVMLNFFNATCSSLGRTLLSFHEKIRKLSKIYEWQKAVLPLAIDFHTEVTTVNHTDTEAWTLSQTWIDQFCTPLHVLSHSAKRAASFSLDEHVTKKRAGEICRNFNTKGCTYNKCARKHKCSKCNSRDHGEHACTKTTQ